MGLGSVVKVARFQLTTRTFSGIFSAHSPRCPALSAVFVLCFYVGFRAFSFGFGYHRRVFRLRFPPDAGVVTALSSRRPHKTNAVLCSFRVLFGIHDARDTSPMWCTRAAVLLRVSPAERTRATASGQSVSQLSPLVGGFVPIAQQGCHLKKQRKSRRIARVRALVRGRAFAGGGSRVSRAGASQVRGRVRRSPVRARPKVWALAGKKLYKK